jgi:hypothetical protein
LGEDASAEGAGGLSGNASLEEELDAIGPADVEVVADDLLEELASMNGPVEDVCGADLHLHDAELVEITGMAVVRAEWVRENA